VTRAVVRRENGWWMVTWHDRPFGRFRYWKDAVRHAVVVAAQMRRGEPTA
jgi:hypothetical protein